MVSDYTALTGRIPLPPTFALGYQQACYGCAPSCPHPVGPFLDGMKSLCRASFMEGCCMQHTCLRVISNHLDICVFDARRYKNEQLVRLHTLTFSCYLHLARNQPGRKVHGKLMLYPACSGGSAAEAMQAVAVDQLQASHHTAQGPQAMHAARQFPPLFSGYIHESLVCMLLTVHWPLVHQPWQRPEHRLQSTFQRSQ